jgi:hypothetical protein
VLWRRWDLVDRLAGERDAYVISDVLAYASREATRDRRQTFAAMIRATLRPPRFALESRMLAAADELEALDLDLEDGELALDPACAVACSRLLNDLTSNPNPAVLPQELRSRIFQIRSRFRRA